MKSEREKKRDAHKLNETKEKEKNRQAKADGMRKDLIMLEAPSCF